MKVNKKEIIVRLLKQIYDLIDYNLELKKEREELEKKLLKYDKE
jgi:hypothetical protein